MVRDRPLEMKSTKKKLEDQLIDLGNRVANPPSDVEELLHLLDQTVVILSRVEQSPSTSTTDALRPAMSSLISKDFLKNPETDVKVFVAACLSEITRITAPEEPYNDSLVKEVFTRIVDSFRKFDDISSRTYSKRVSILETMAKSRSCVIMLDLECNDLILQMFKHFLKTSRAPYECVFIYGDNHDTRTGGETIFRRNFSRACHLRCKCQKWIPCPLHIYWLRRLLINVPRS